MLTRMLVIGQLGWQVKWGAYFQEGDKYVVVMRRLRLKAVQKGGIETANILVSSPDSRLVFKTNHFPN